MEYLNIGLFCVSLLLLLISIGVNIGLSFILAGFFASLLMLSLNSAISLLGETAYNSIARPTWIAIPLFILMGSICASGGLARLAYVGAYTLTRKLPGSLLIATCLSCGIFATISGSSTATTAMFSRMALPEMARYGYDRALSVGCIASAGTFASMIPPSILLIVYALFANLSLKELFAAGIVPGLITIVAYCLAIIIFVKRKPNLTSNTEVKEVSVADHSRSRALVSMWPIIVLAIIVLGGLYGGILTPTEAAAAGSIASLILAVLFGTMKEFPKFISAINEAARVSAMLFLLIVGALYFSRVFAFTGLPQQLTEFIISAQIPKITILLSILAVIFLMGMIMVPVGIFALTLPILLPSLSELGYDPIWFGIIMLKLMEIAAITPPVGLNAFAIKAAAPSELKITFAEIYRGSSLFLLVDLLVLAILIAFPSLVLWLPTIV